MSGPAPIVFIVDDDEAVRASLRLLLKSVGIAAQAFASAQEFLACYDASKPGCLILDIRMPGMSGMELQHDLIMRGAIIPVIFITGHGDVPMAVEAMKNGAFDFLQKPFRDQELIDRVQRALAKDGENRVALSRISRRDSVRSWSWSSLATPVRILPRILASASVPSKSTEPASWKNWKFRPWRRRCA